MIVCLLGKSKASLDFGKFQFFHLLKPWVMSHEQVFCPSPISLKSHVFIYKVGTHFLQSRAVAMMIHF